MQKDKVHKSDRTADVPTVQGEETNGKAGLCASQVPNRRREQLSKQTSARMFRVVGGDRLCSTNPEA